MNFKDILENLTSSGSLEELSLLLKNNKLSEVSTKFKGKILNSINFENKNYINLTIQIEDNIGNQFISLNTLKAFEIGDNIEFMSKDILLNSIDGEVYVGIVRANIKKEKNKNQIINININPNFHLDIFKFIYSYNKL